jgi:hypothetical protein
MEILWNYENYSKQQIFFPILWYGNFDKFERERNKKHSQIYMGKHMYPNFPTFFVRKRQKLFEKITQSNRSWYKINF